MRTPRSHIILGPAVMVVSAFISIAQSNRSASLILPPADWDAGTHRLASLVATNKPGEYALPLAWVGNEKVTARLGWYATKEAVREQTTPPAGSQPPHFNGPGRWMEFDKLTVSPEKSHLPLRADRFISTGEEVFGRAYYRASLPSDAELLGMRDLLSVSNLLGCNPFSCATNAQTWDAVSVRYFALRPYDSIETVQATFMKRGKDPAINILVKRGRMHPQPKTE